MQIQQAEIHGHEVLDMMTASGTPYSIASLRDAMDAKFGAEARFCICSGGGMKADELIEVLWAKGKFAGTRAEFVFDTGTRCDH